VRRRRHRIAGASDDQLIGRARSGDHLAFGELYQRHRRAAEATAQWMLRSRAEVDDVVADAFAGVLEALHNGNGPRDNFRTYLLAAVRNGCRSRWQRNSLAAENNRRLGTDDSSVFEDPERYVEADTVARAFASLSPRWQQTLWLTEVEQRSSAEVAAQLHLAPNATAALTHRAREAFATAYLAEHIDSAPDDACDRYAPRLAAFVRGQLTDSKRDDVERHLVDCLRCQQAVDELRDVNSSLRKLVPPAIPVLAAPLSVGTTLPSVTGLFSSGLILKGAAAVLVAAPLLFNVTGGFGGGGTPDDGAVRTVVAEPLAADVDPEPNVVRRLITPADVPGDRASAREPESTTKVPRAAMTEPPARSAAPDTDESTPDPGIDDVVDPIVDEVVDPVVGGVVVPVVGGVVDPVIDEVVDPVIDEVVVPVVDEVVAPVVDEVVAPVIDEVVVPVIDEVVDPVIDEVVVPVVDEVVAPVVDEVVVPVVDEVVAPVVDPVVVPVVDPVVDPLVDPVIDEVVGPVVDEVVPTVPVPGLPLGG
jgi:RNA polymerase sigma factor (sigma-70 family)